MSDWPYMAVLVLDKEVSDGPFTVVLTRGRPSIKTPPRLTIDTGNKYSELSSDDHDHDIDLEDQEEFPPPRVAKPTSIRNRYNPKTKLILED